MLDKLVNKIKEQKLNVNIEKIEKAYLLAEEAHGSQFRESGEPYLIHPVEVALILIEMGLDTDTICAALLHDVVEDTDYTYDDIVDMFNEDVANLVEGVTKLGKIKYKSKEEQQAENIRKMLLAMANDVRVILIKLADRLHNMRTLKFLPPEKQKVKAKETIDIFSPIAHRLGISKVKWELEDLGLRYLSPEDYYSIGKLISQKRAERLKTIDQIVNILHSSLSKSSIEADIEGRPKHFYSIYRKMILKHKTFDQIFDLLAVRVLVDSVKDCYAALGIVHTLWKPIPGRFKDYIAMPKPNMYQSLHSTLIGPEGQPFEIQIRTFEMHKIAEYGIAAHWKYKEGIKGDDIESRLSWLREIAEYQTEAQDATEFMETVKIDFFSDKVFVFTPRGKVIDLPIESTPIDFAYRIHTDVGNKCVGAKVNGKMVSLDYVLNTGDIVDIITSSSAKGPSRDWLSIAKSSQAKSKIKHWFKRSFKEENLEKGRESLERECKRQGIPFSEVMKHEHVDMLLRRFNYQTLDDLFSSMGSGAITAAQLLTRVKDEIKKAEVKQEPEKLVYKPSDKTSSDKKKRIINKKPGVDVKGEKDILVRFAKCCSPVPGDEIEGFITRGRGVSIHRTDCENYYHLKQAEPEKVIDVCWTGEHTTDFLADINIRGTDRGGLLSDITSILFDSKISLRAMNARTGQGEAIFISLTVKVIDADQLDKVMKNIKNIQGVAEVYRSKS
ncbi:RelA/SpoT family protein [Clostridium cylindrosporum]|uniref:GTP diphosphokinase n=1 Tax=Clostridium cylindrosporum DSM 605 TaxID=1121307 RepID=A0A0J8DAE2_CLOCY|nr:bifunctional (p)ppGpp synthetase/guanosine-3',5'-bis(diphosphate) 3'-pyrophosphohydrolase [Clostridium cylindrosporum]KMT21273.1 GTP pyrophosphokinase RelA [Clostridium cylindrosporum DSM 605]